MNDNELIQYIGEKFKHCRNRIKSVKEVFPKEINEENKFEEILYKIMKDYIVKKK